MNEKVKDFIANFLEILDIDSTSGQEKELSEYLAVKIVNLSSKTHGKTCKLSRFDVGDGTENLLFSWGKPFVTFCTHQDTVPPYIKTTTEKIPGKLSFGLKIEDEEIIPDYDIKFKGRGTCDAKGQLISLLYTCLTLQNEGKEDFALLLLSGEETGSHGAQHFASSHAGGEFVIVGEPTENKIIKAAKGTDSFLITINGKKAHSGYPELGISAINRFVNLASDIAQHKFPVDEICGETTYNFGQLRSDNPQNIISDLVTCRCYFRNTAASKNYVKDLMMSYNDNLTTIEDKGGDVPISFFIPEEIIKEKQIPIDIVSFGSDAPRLNNYKYKLLYGPGTIRVAHQKQEYILLSDILKAIHDYHKIYKMIELKKFTIL